MGQKLFVSNLDFSIDEDELRNIFSEVGTPVKITIAYDRNTGRSRGYAFIEMTNSEEAEKAIKELHRKPFHGRPISVAEDTSDKNRGDRQAHQQLPSMQRVMIKRRRRVDPFIADPTMSIDYKDVTLLKQFISERGKILPRKLTGLSSYNQRKMSRAIKRAQHSGLLSAVIQ